MPHNTRSDPLAEYRRKRAAGGTPEPFGGRRGSRSGLFVVQKHSARRLHYDLRLEVDGVLRSWAVPKGPSLDPDEKRLAVQTEDHPLEYGDFEGVIPADNYGAGAVILWDRGPTVHHLDPETGGDEGKYLFELKGFKLRGLWTLVKTSRAEKEWLLIKKPDAEATGDDAADMDPHSVLSGLTVEQMRDGATRSDEIRQRLEELGAPERRIDAKRLRPMLATLEREPFRREGWLFELKYDGYRLMAERSGKRRAATSADVRLRYRSGLDATSIYPDVALALRSLPYDRLLIDGEIVVLDDNGKPSFQRLQQRARLSRPIDVETAAVALPATYFAFDLLALEGFDLRPLPLTERKAILREILPPKGPVRFADHVATRGLEFYEQVQRMGLEGMLAKRGDAPYRSGRSRSWVKIRAERTGDFAVVGFTVPKGSRAGFGALHVAIHDGNGLVYAGRVGTGFSGRRLESLRAQLEPFRRDEPAFEGTPAAKGDVEHVWVEPQMVVEARYTEFTRDGHLRHPVFVRVRDDKKISDCERDDLPPAPAVEAAPKDLPRKVSITRPEKIFWPEEKITKGDLIGYYRAVGDRLLPYLTDRPLVLDRYPDGYKGKSFFQKNAPEFAPDWVRTEPVWSGEEGDKETRYFICDDAETLTYLINSGAIPLHVWSSRLSDLQAPDWCILDLDAKDAAFEQVVAVAKAIHALCKDIGLPTYVKTSGATGMHVLIPLGRQCTHEQSKQLAFLLAQLVSQERPDIASIARTPSRRAGKVYLDAIQNGYGKLLVAPFSARPRAGAPVSTPLHWREVNGKLDPAKFTVRSLPARLKRLRKDPWEGMLESRPDLPAALARLSERL